MIPQELPENLKVDWDLAFGVGYVPPAEMRSRWQASLLRVTEQSVLLREWINCEPPDNDGGMTADLIRRTLRLLRERPKNMTANDG